MPRTLPSSLEAFLIADSLVMQPGGKVTIIGAFAGRQILVPPGTAFPATFQLAIYAVFLDGEGTFSTKIRIVGPGEVQVTGELAIPESVKIAGQPMQLAVNFSVLQLPSPGNYTVEIRLDDKIYTKDFSIRVSDKPIS